MKKNKEEPKTTSADVLLRFCRISTCYVNIFSSTIAGSLPASLWRMVSFVEGARKGIEVGEGGGGICEREGLGVGSSPFDATISPSKPGHKDF